MPFREPAALFSTTPRKETFRLGSAWSGILPEAEKQRFAPLSAFMTFFPCRICSSIERTEPHFSCKTRRRRHRQAHFQIRDSLCSLQRRHVWLTSRPIL